MLTRRNMLAAVATAGPALAWAQGASSSPPGDARAPALPGLGTPLPLARVPLLDGGTFQPAQAEGQVLVVYWWASWCPFCAVQSPHIEKLWRSQRERGLQVLALSIDQKRENAANYLRQKGYTFPAGMLTPEVAKILPKPKGLPVTVARGRNGRVVFAEAGEMFPEDIEGLAKFL
ncbi:TlpA family protein disulfide reductase [Variovorax terrae]|uniref:TlpA family protein disulfide reductase n=1 Tax=Variovorax terrae TaxID=2923278 RepID=A0A9X1W150_9BURK|nr:TlpA disulfide reductase family protein [Variovorax terrae]MCJ0765782.1 TlpA family protein disulfide reductase [Variovorax terrae]